jgi:adenylate cyclase
VLPLNYWIDREPKRFSFYYRLMGYGMMSLVLLIYHVTHDDNSPARLYLLFLFALLVLSYPRLSSWLQYRFSTQIQKNIFFLIDITFTAITLSAVHLSLVLTLCMLLATLYTVISSRISILVVLLSSMLGIVAFYFSNILAFGFEPYFQQTSVEITVLAFLCLMAYCAVGNLYHANSMDVARQKREYYYSQMNRYMEFANQLSRYAPQQLWQSIMKGETEAKIEYKRKKMTIFFSDIEGFTELSENLIPDDLAFLLNDYLRHMTEIAKQYEGTVDKFMGDAILIFFGDPASQGAEQDAKTCVEMAMAMRQQMKILRERWIKMGYPALHIRMGISTGYCHVGNYGAAHRMAYTIVGRDANLAARLQSAAEVDEILISDDTYQLIKDTFLCAPKAPMSLKGIQEPVKTWQVMEKYATSQAEYQRWFDYEYKGFHLLLNLDEVQNFEYTELIQVLERMVQRIKTQQNLINAQGVVRLSLEDEVAVTISRDTHLNEPEEPLR